MSQHPSAFATAALVPGWYGKLPGMGDFAHRRMPESFLQAWDAWLQAGLHGLRERHSDWVQHYLEGDLWFFLLGPGVASARPWLGVLMPSVDSAGRYFPLTLAAELAQWSPVLGAEQAAQCRAVWLLAQQVALVGLEEDLDANGFENLLQSSFAQSTPRADAGIVAELPLPAPGQTSWQLNPQAGYVAELARTPLPQGQTFDALFGFAPGAQSLEQGIMS